LSMSFTVSRTIPEPSPNVMRPLRSTIATSPTCRMFALHGIQISSVFSLPLSTGHGSGVTTRGPRVSSRRSEMKANSSLGVHHGGSHSICTRSRGSSQLWPTHLRNSQGGFPDPRELRGPHSGHFRVPGGIRCAEMLLSHHEGWKSTRNATACAEGFRNSNRLSKPESANGVFQAQSAEAPGAHR
jgi:hypothetical protein